MLELATEKRAMVSFWDGGRCHFTRAMTVAAELLSRGMQVGAITSDKYADEAALVFGHENTFVVPNRPPQVETPPYEFPLYSHAYGHAQRLKGLGFDDVQWLLGVTEMEIDALDAFRPDVIINDYRDTIRTAAEHRDVPVVAITHTTGNVDGYNFGWWVEPPQGAVLPSCLDSFNAVRTELGLAEISDERYMFSGTHNVIPSIEEIDPLRVASLNTTYVGMISNWQRDVSFSSLDGTLSPKIFSYAGETTRPQYGLERMLSKIVGEETGSGFYIVAGDEQRYDNDRMRTARNQGRVLLDGYIPGFDATSDSDVVLTQGGNGTVALSLSLGKPMICIGPPQSDCSSIFRGVEQHGAGIMINHSSEPLESIKAPDLGKDVDIFGYWTSNITAEQVSNAIHTVTEDPSFRDNAERLGEKYRSLNGAKAVAGIVLGIIN